MALRVVRSPFFRKRRALNDDEREDFGIVQTLTLTLLALIIGFSFSMAVNRYDLRKNYEEAGPTRLARNTSGQPFYHPMPRRCVSC